LANPANILANFTLKTGRFQILFIEINLRLWHILNYLNRTLQTNLSITKPCKPSRKTKFFKQKPFTLMNSINQPVTPRKPQGKSLNIPERKNHFEAHNHKE
jgi:hypothetical protein